MDAFLLPDFESPALRAAPEARFEPAPADGVLPEGFHSTTNLPTWVRVDQRWERPRGLRMDAVIVRTEDGLEVIEARRVRAGQAVALGLSEDGGEGIVVARIGTEGGGEFRFMSTAVSRERPIDYSRLARILVRERRRGGHVLWVVGPALVHAKARDHLVWFIENGLVQSLSSGNALATHDIEQSLYGTALGVRPDGSSPPGGHSFHLRAINRIRAAGSIAAAVASGELKDGIVHALLTRGVPLVLAGSIRDDGPLPDVITDALLAQDAMRALARSATCALFLATALHAIAVGNMLPAFVDDEHGLRPLPSICVDQTEFVVNKLRDRGTHQAFGVVTNAQDFLGLLRAAVLEEEGRASA